MKLGVLLPTFRVGADDAVSFADEAARLGIDGVFAYDHLWPIGSPQRPSLAPFPLLAVVARRHEQLVVGPLVARIGLVGTDHLVEQFTTLEALAPGRVVAALGTGDKLSEPENAAYGLVHLGADERRGLLEETSGRLCSIMPVWIGAGARATNQLAHDLGVALNLWDAPIERVNEAAALGEVTCAGPVPEDLHARLDALEGAGATWAVFSPEVNIESLVAWRRSR